MEDLPRGFLQRDGRSPSERIQRSGQASFHVSNRHAGLSWYTYVESLDNFCDCLTIIYSASWHGQRLRGRQLELSQMPEPALIAAAQSV